MASLDSGCGWPISYCLVQAVYQRPGQAICVGPAKPMAVLSSRLSPMAVLSRPANAMASLSRWRSLYQGPMAALSRSYRQHPLEAEILKGLRAAILATPRTELRKFGSGPWLGELRVKLRSRGLAGSLGGARLTCVSRRVGGRV